MYVTLCVFVVSWRSLHVFVDRFSVASIELFWLEVDR